MGIIKGCLKVAGTIALGITGAASKVLEEGSNAMGFELGSGLFGAAKEASMDGIKSMWSSDNVDQTLDYADIASTGAGTRQMARTAKQAADLAKQHGDMEKYEYYMEIYNQYKE